MDTPRSRRLRLLVRDALFVPGATEAIRSLRPLFNLLTLLGILAALSMAAIPWLHGQPVGRVWIICVLISVSIRVFIWIADMDDAPQE